MFKTASQLNQDLHQINIASIDVLMQLVQVVESMRDNQRTMQVVLAELLHENSGAARGSLEQLREAMDHTESIALDLPEKLGPLLARLKESIANYS